MKNLKTLLFALLLFFLLNINSSNANIIFYPYQSYGSVDKLPKKYDKLVYIRDVNVGEYVYKIRLHLIVTGYVDETQCSFETEIIDGKFYSGQEKFIWFCLPPINDDGFKCLEYDMSK